MIDLYPFNYCTELHEKRGIQDVTPTILQTLSIDKPPEMTGCDLIK